MSFANPMEASHLICSRCNTVFPDGVIRFRVDVHITADTGAGMSSQELVKELNELVDLLQGSEAPDPADESHANLHFYLCRACRDEYLKGPDTPLSSFFFGE